MTIEKVTLPYEIMFRLADTGSVSGCHRRDIEVVRDSETGEVYSAKELDPQPISGGNEMDAVLGQINSSLAQSLAEKDIELASKSASLDSANDQLMQVVAQSEDLTAQLDLANQTIEQKDAMIAQLMAQINQ